MKKAALAALLCAATALPASAQQVKPEDQIKLRQSAYALMGHHMGVLAGMAQGKRPYDKDLAARSASRLVTLSEIPREFFGPDSDLGETKAKPGIWKNRADFDKKMDRMVTEVKRLPQASADLASLKQAVGDVGAACKSCHDDYREK